MDNTSTERIIELHNKQKEYFATGATLDIRSEEHTSELQSL